NETVELVLSTQQLLVCNPYPPPCACLQASTGPVRTSPVMVVCHDWAKAYKPELLLTSEKCLPLLSFSELPENWTDTKETLLEGMVFNVKYLGMTLVGQPKGEDMAAAAIRRIVTTARASAKKFRKVTLTVSPKGIIITDTETSDLIEDVSIYRISYCTADKAQDKVFAYVSQSQFSETLECHAFLCQKKKIAQAVTLTVAQAFKVALDLWEIAQEDKSKKARTCCSCSGSDPQGESKPHCVSGTNMKVYFSSIPKDLTPVHFFLRDLVCVYVCV
ncbi:hypothetical protein P4O66_009029, partial [Electrophorus voltai]